MWPGKFEFQHFFVIGWSRAGRRTLLLLFGFVVDTKRARPFSCWLVLLGQSQTLVSVGGYVWGNESWFAVGWGVGTLGPYGIAGERCGEARECGVKGNGGGHIVHTHQM